MIAAERLLSRRRVMRGMLNGSAVTVALPFLNVSGWERQYGGRMRSAFASCTGSSATASRRPAMGHLTRLARSPASLPEQIKALESVKADQHPVAHAGPHGRSRPNRPAHGSGVAGWEQSRRRQCRAQRQYLISDQIKPEHAFRSLGATTGNPSEHDELSGQRFNPVQPGPIRFPCTPASLDRVTDPNAGTFTPDPHVMAKRSVLSPSGTNAPRSRAIWAPKTRLARSIFHLAAPGGNPGRNAAHQAGTAGGVQQVTDNPGEDKPVDDQLDHHCHTS